MAEGASAASGQCLAYYYYVPEGGYAPNGNILIDSDYVMGDWYFTYDSLDRIASATPDITAPTQYLNKYLCWSYDVYGNRTMEMASATPCPGTAPTTQIGAYYNTRNQITSTYGGRGATFVYDAAGDTTYDGVNNYWYDAEGRLCAVQSFNSVTQYFYDAEGARVARGALSAAPAAGSTCSATTLATTSGLTLNKRYLVDLGGDQATELNLNGTAATWVHSNIWLAGRLNATYDTKGLHFPLTDALGTKRVQMSAFGTWEEYCTSLPFGNDVGNPNAAQCTLNNAPTVASTADDATEHHFTGKERDTESGNDYFGARYDSSSMGRFLSPDPLGGTLANPQSLNRYAYVLNNPLRLIDPSGMSACGDDSSDGGGCVQNEDFQLSSVSGMSSLFGSSSFGSSNQGISPIAAHWEPCKDGSNSNCYVGDYDREIRCNFSAGCLQWHNNCGCWDKPTGPDPHDNMPGHDAFSLSIDEVNAQSLQGLSQDVLRAPTAPKPRVTPPAISCLLAPEASMDIADSINQANSEASDESFSADGLSEGVVLSINPQHGWRQYGNNGGAAAFNGAALAADYVVSAVGCGVSK